MKKVFEHPTEPVQGRKYWRSVEEYSGTPEFQNWLQREFPQGAAEFWGDGVSRRNFLRLMGASMALAGLQGCRRPEAHIVPYTKSPEWVVAGKNIHFTTAMPRRGGSTPLLVTSYDGRPTKIEGNPLHPVNKGTTDTHAQASILDLYDPDRAKSYLKNGKISNKAEFDTALAAIRDEALKNQGAGLAFLVQETLSPTRDRLKQELFKQFPQATWSVYEPLITGNDAKAASIAFGGNYKAVPRFDKADVVFSLSADFLGGEFGLSAERGFASKRRILKPGDPMNRLYTVETQFTLTGGMADHRLRLPASQLEAFASALAREAGAGGMELPMATALEGVDPKWISEAAKDLKAHAGTSLVVAGPNTSVALQVIALAINQALGNIGKTVLIKPAPAPSTSIVDLAAKIRTGAVNTVVILGGNPAYNAPADLKFGELLRKISNVVYLGYHENATTEASSWQVPAAHYLESWGDTLAEDGSYLSIQPLILPLFNGLSEIELLSRFLGQPTPQGPEQVQETFKQRSPGLQGTALEAAWKKFLHDGFVPVAATSSTAVATGTAPNSVNLPASSAFLKTVQPLSSPANGTLEVTFVPSWSVDDGRYANNGWMQEAPDPITKLTWDNAALISPKTAKDLGLEARVYEGVQTSDVISITLNGVSIEAPIIVVPGHADNSLTLPLGFGQKLGRVSEGSGFNAYLLRTSVNPYLAVGAAVKKVSSGHELALTQEHQSMEGRGFVREAPLAIFEKDPAYVDTIGVDAHAPPNVSFYQSPPLTGHHQWGMSIDLTTCTGCNSCVVACQAENNIPIVGRDQVKRSREMHWIRIDRYFVSEDYNEDLDKFAHDPQMVMQPMTCQHCENAPCETVCPVNATVHSEEGLNVMAYNRCIGTRYCANNCPYKVRRFNFFDYNKRDVLSRNEFLNIGNLYMGPLGDKGSPDTIKMQKNPNVTVRMRGVMEKCTFCVQRIEEAKINQLVKARDTADTMVPRDSVKVACQQACPSESIVFGNVADPESEVSKRKALAHDYAVLNYLNVRPRVTYLGRIRNPNPAMPGANLVGMSSLGAPDYHGPHGEHGHGAHPAEGGHEAAPAKPAPGEHH